MTDEIVQWADRAMYHSEPDLQALAGEPVTPKVTLLSMTRNPLRVMAAAASLYSGGVMRDPFDVPEAEARKLFADMTKTTLKAPLEFIDLHFLFEGVTRAFTHQLVRQRTAVYVQESMRFAVKDNAAFEVALPPSLQGLHEDDPRLVMWNQTVKDISRAYNALINAGVPAEDARGLLPTNITTRVHYKTNLRNLAEHAGMRLCSQAQQEWKQVWRGIVEAILAYPTPNDTMNTWQYREIVRLFKPVCYSTGKCEFMASTDRHCSIRERVELHHQAGVPSSHWNDINPLEPLAEGAARLAP
jgi:flavin-dependent thymidylate synthase